MYEIVKALKAAIKFFGYILKEIQSDNKFEFSDRTKRKENGKNNRKCPDILEDFLNKYGVKHHFMRPRTPKLNEKVGRNHRTDQEKFYRTLKFYSLGDLREQGLLWMRKYNNSLRFCLNFKTTNEVELESFKNIYQNTGAIRCPRCFASFVS